MIQLRDERLLESVERVEAIVGIRLGLDSMHRGEGRPSAQALSEIRRRHRKSHGG